MNKKFYITKATVAMFFVLTFFLFAILHELFELYVFDVLSHVSIKAIVVAVCLIIIEKVFEKTLPVSVKKLTVLCGAILAAEFLLLDTLRLVLGGDSSILLLPACLPLTGAVIVFLFDKERGIGRKEKVIAYSVCAVFFAVAMYFEVMSLI